MYEWIGYDAGRNKGKFLTVILWLAGVDRSTVKFNIYVNLEMLFHNSLNLRASILDVTSTTNLRKSNKKYAVRESQFMQSCQKLGGAGNGLNKQ